MNFSASFRHLGMILVSLSLLAIASTATANTVISSQTIDANTTYSAADEQGRFVYLIQFAEPGLIEQHSRRSSQPFDYQTPANLAARDNLMAVQAEHVRTIGQTLGRAFDPSHHYLASKNGIAARLTPEEAQQVLALPSVVDLQRERVYELSTYRGPEFIGATDIWNGTGVPDGSPHLGEGLIAAVLDTGIPDPTSHASFVNDPACGHGEGANPDKVLSFLDCSSSDGTGLCNGAAPVDTNGHGSHTASTVAGNTIDNAASPPPGIPALFDEMSGVAPCANIRSYKVCPGSSCPGADIAAGLESVLIHDDASVLNYSISGGASPWNDFDRTKLDLVAADIFVAASAGNTSASVTDPVGAVNHRGPWVMSVAASTHDTVVGKSVSLVGGPTGVPGLEGTGPAMTVDLLDDLRYAGDVDPANFEGCAAFPASAFDGLAALISRGSCTFADKVNNAVAAGATFVIVFNNAPGLPIVMGGLDATTVSSVMVSNSNGTAMVSALAGGTAQVTVTAESQAFVEPAAGDILAGFSLRGPTASPLQDLQKPNITAPGVNIYAAVPGGYAFLSGTSMSGPHVAGAGLLVRQANPGWTVSEVKSAMQMTAFKDGTKEDGTTPWDWDDVGHGRVDLTKAALSGLVMDESIANYLAANPATGGDVKTLNLPDVRNLACTPTCTFERTLRNTLGVASNWTVTADSGNANLDLQVSPATFSFTGNITETVTLTITATPQVNLTGAIEFGQIILTEDAAQAPEAHLTTAISGTNFEPPVADVDASEFVILLEENGIATETFNISNLGDAGLSANLNYTIEEAQPFNVVLGGGPAEPVNLAFDGGIATIINGGNQQWLWMNQFTPGALDLPFTLESIDIGFAPGNGGVVAGDLFDVYVWTDPDRDPRTGADFMVSVTGQAITSGVNFQTVVLPGGGVPITVDSGDVLIGVVNRTSAASYAVAVADAPGNSQQRSWAGLGFPGGVAGSPPDFSQPGFFGLIDEQLPGRNWTIRGSGTGGSACLQPSDVSWLTVTPAAGSIAGGASEQIQVDVDMTGLGQGQFEGRLCIQTNDPENPVYVLPVSVTAVAPGGLPTIDVAPTSLAFNVDVLATGDSQNVDIANTGNDLGLEWLIEEALPLSLRQGGPSLPVNGMEAWAALGDPANSSMTLEIGVGNQVTGIGYEVTIETLGSSWLSESRLAVLSNAGDPLSSGAEIIPGTGEDAGGTQTFSSGGIVALTTPVDANAAGEIYLEWFEDFVDGANPDSVWSDPLNGQVLPPGLTLQCTNQAFCDAAMAGLPLPSSCDLPSDVSWLSVSPASGTTAAASTSPVSVAVDATGLAPGMYDAILCIQSNDPATPLVEVPVSMEVIVPANAALIEGTVEGLGRCQIEPTVAAGASVDVVGQIETFNLIADANGFYSLYLDDANGPVDITASAANHLTGLATGVAIAGQTTTVVDFGLVLEAPCAAVSPASFNEIFAPGNTTGSFNMTIDNSDGGAQLVWGIQEADPSVVRYGYGLEGGGEISSISGADRASDQSGSSRGAEQSPFVDAAVQGSGPIDGPFAEPFDDITLLPSAGWSLQNLSDPLGTSDWFQGNDAVFPSHQGAPAAYIGANFNNTAGGTGIISNWLMTPEIVLRNGTELSFWTRRSTSSFPDRLEVRLSTSGTSTFAGASATEVGDFDTLMLSINENLVAGGYPQTWTQFTVTVEGLTGTTSGRIGFRYFVTSAGPSGDNSDYIGIDTVGVVQPEFCQDPSDLPWLSVTPFFGATAAGGSDAVSVDVDASGLAEGNHEAIICVNTNDQGAEIIPVPFNLNVQGDTVFQDRFEG